MDPGCFITICQSVPEIGSGLFHQIKKFRPSEFSQIPGNISRASCTENRSTNDAHSILLQFYIHYVSYCITLFSRFIPDTHERTQYELNMLLTGLQDSPVVSIALIHPSNLSIIRPFDLYNSCTKHKVNKHCYWPK